MNIEALQNLIQEFCEEYAIVEEGNGRDYMNKWFNRNYDRIEEAITKEIKQARIDELKQLEPPEQFEDYARLMGSEHCKICGFNAIKFREHIENRIKELNKD